MMINCVRKCRELVLRNRSAGPFGLLNILNDRCGRYFRRYRNRHSATGTHRIHGQVQGRRRVCDRDPEQRATNHRAGCKDRLAPSPSRCGVRFLQSCAQPPSAPARRARAGGKLHHVSQGENGPQPGCRKRGKISVPPMAPLSVVAINPTTSDRAQPFFPA